MGTIRLISILLSETPVEEELTTMKVLLIAMFIIILAYILREEL